MSDKRVNQDEAAIAAADSFQEASPYEMQSPSFEEGETLFEDVAVFFRELKDYASHDSGKQEEILTKLDRLRNLTKFDRLRSGATQEMYLNGKFPVEEAYRVYEMIQGNDKLWDLSFSASPIYLLLLCFSPAQIASNSSSDQFQSASSKYSLAYCCRAVQKKHGLGDGIIRYSKLQQNNNNIAPYKRMLFLSRVYLAMALFGYEIFNDVRGGGTSLLQKCCACVCRLDIDLSKRSSTAVTTPSIHSAKKSRVEEHQPEHKSAASASSSFPTFLSTGELHLPKAAEEIDFEIFDPPLKPVVPESIVSILKTLYDVNSHDVVSHYSVRECPGNGSFQKLVLDFQAVYLASTNREKKLLARTIILIIRKRGGRFLKRNSITGAMFEIGDNKAITKVARSLGKGFKETRRCVIAQQNLAETEPQRAQAVLQVDDSTAQGHAGCAIGDITAAGDTTGSASELNVAAGYDAIAEAGYDQEHVHDPNDISRPRSTRSDAVDEIACSTNACKDKTVSQSHKSAKSPVAQSSDPQAGEPAARGPGRVFDLCFDNFYGRMVSIGQENRSLRTKHMRLQAEVMPLREKGQYAMLCFEKLFRFSTDGDCTDEGVEGNRSWLRASKPLTELEDIAAPTNFSAKNFMKDSSAYLQEVEAQNAALQTENAQLEKEVKSWKKTYDEAYDELDKFLLPAAR